MFSFLYAICLLIYCLYTLFEKDRDDYINLVFAFKEYAKTKDVTEIKKFGGTILSMIFFSFSELIFYANLAVHKIIYPFSAIIFFAHLISVLIGVARKKKLTIPSERRVVFGKMFTMVEVFFLFYYLYHRIS